MLVMCLHAISDDAVTLPCDRCALEWRTPCADCLDVVAMGACPVCEEAIEEAQAWSIEQELLKDA